VSSNGSGPPRTRLSALIVNYNTGGFAVRCAESLMVDWLRSGRLLDDLEVIVVDNASPTDQSEPLAKLEDLGAAVIRHERNDGYASGMNLAYAASSGGPQDVVAILNPDLYFLPGTVDKLLRYLREHPECGTVGPKAFIDHAKVMNLPRNPLPTLADHVRVALAQMSPALCRAYSKRRLRSALPWWEARAPLEADMLSGCCLFLRREVVQRMPSLMDERYPLYYEDTDLFRTLRRLGYTVVLHGDAQILHHWSRSTGVGAEFNDEPMRRYKASQREYFRKFYGSLGARAAAAVNWATDHWPESRSFRPMHAVEHLGSWSNPIHIPLPRRCRFLMELTMAPVWILAVGIMGEGDEWICPEATWEWYFQAHYFMRGIDLDTGEVLGAWSFEKCVPGRMGPLELPPADAELLAASLPPARRGEDGPAAEEGAAGQPPSGRREGAL